VSDYHISHRPADEEAGKSVVIENAAEVLDKFWQFEIFHLYCSKLAWPAMSSDKGFYIYSKIKKAALGAAFKIKNVPCETHW